MGMLLFVLGAVFVFVSVIGLKRQSVSVGGRMFRTEVTGKLLYVVVIPQIVTGILAILFSLALLFGMRQLAPLSEWVLYLLLGTYLAVNIGLGWYQFGGEAEGWLCRLAVN